MTKITISALSVYPVKSLAGISLQTSVLDSRGLQYDRRWMVVSPDGMFLTQRKTPQMALIKTAINDDYLVLSKVGKADHHILLEESKQSRCEKISVTIWRDTLQASLVGEESDAWLSDALGLDCHLVYMDEDILRQCDLNYAKQGDQTGFADAYPLLMISEASLEDLNKRLLDSKNKAVEMRRFRPNVVVTGCEPFAEDSWERISIANIPMKGVKLCERCVLTTVDPDKGERSGSEPLMTLAKYRKIDNKVCFGQNIIHQEQGILKIGDELTIS